MTSRDPLEFVARQAERVASAILGKAGPSLRVAADPATIAGSRREYVRAWAFERSFRQEAATAICLGAYAAAWALFAANLHLPVDVASFAVAAAACFIQLKLASAKRVRMREVMRIHEEAAEFAERR